MARSRRSWRGQGASAVSPTEAIGSLVIQALGGDGSTGAGRRSRRPRPQHQARMTATAGQGQAMLTWNTPVAQRPEFPFVRGDAARGDISQMFASAEQLYHDGSLVAAIGLMDYIVLHRGEYADQARSELTKLLLQVTPTPAAIKSARMGMREAQQAGGSLESQLTAQLSRCEVEFLHFITQGQGSPQGLIGRLKQIVGELAERQISRRQASAHIMLAVCYLSQRELLSAQTEMGTALMLLSQSYNNPALAELVTTFDEPMVERTTGSITRTRHASER